VRGGLPRSALIVLKCCLPGGDNLHRINEGHESIVRFHDRNKKVVASRTHSLVIHPLQFGFLQRVGKRFVGLSGQIINGQGVPPAKWAEWSSVHLGGCSPGDESHSSTLAAVYSWRAFRKSISRSMLWGV
jgi:hypothetical protein